MAALFGLASAPNPDKPAVRVIVGVEGLRNTSGQLRVALFGKDGFPKDESKILFGAQKPVSGTNQVVTLEDVPPGGYAILVHHDENGNSRMDYDFLGRPREGYGVSNNVRHLFRAPSYGEAEVSIAPGASEFRVRLKY